MQVLITKINQTINEGIILDAWINSGDFCWNYVSKDTHYKCIKNINKSKHFGNLEQVKLLLFSTLLNSVGNGKTNNIHGWKTDKLVTNCYYFIRVRVSYYYKLLMSYNSLIELQRKPTLDCNQVSSYISLLYQASTILNTF